MALIQESHDSLPYIDLDASPQEREQIARLIAAELPPESRTTLHPSIPELPASKLTPLAQKELDRKGAGVPITGGVDLTRYEAPEPPSDSALSGLDNTEAVRAWRTSLQKAYTSSTHLSGRLTNLGLLEELGKNAWLIGNAELEDILRALEKELANLKTTTDAVNKARRAAQEGVKGEIVGLEESWKRGVGRIIEVEIAAGALRREILERRRQGAR